MRGYAGSPITAAELELLRGLVRENVRFMVVGLGAAVIQDADLATKDLDLWFESTSHPGVAAAAAAAGGTLVWRSTPPVFSGEGLESIDIVLKCDGLASFDEEYENALDVLLVEGLVIKVLPIARVLASKKAAGRRKDLAAIPALEAAIAARDEVE